MSKAAQNRILAVLLIVVVSALGLHAMIHWHEQSFDEQHCQVCHIGHVAVPIPTAQLTLHAPLPVSRLAPSTKTLILLEQFSEHHSPRAPPA
jgi:hypothetical protein